MKKVKYSFDGKSLKERLGAIIVVVTLNDAPNENNKP